MSIRDLRRRLQQERALTRRLQNHLELARAESRLWKEKNLVLTDRLSRVMDQYDQLSARKTWLDHNGGTQKDSASKPHTLLLSCTSSLKLVDSSDATTSHCVDDSELEEKNRTLTAKVRSLEKKLKEVQQSERHFRGKSENMTQEILDIHAQWEHDYEQLRQEADSVMHEMTAIHEHHPGNPVSIARRAMVTPQLRRGSNVSFFGHDFAVCDDYLSVSDNQLLWMFIVLHATNLSNILV